ncbi:hypothetical protein FACS1894186_6120 [Alphaproteobacteria bacterium]|nr:hypothetical protein FACS1894186_6120 [Alphaproteobacteria bacterium]
MEEDYGKIKKAPPRPDSASAATGGKTFVAQFGLPARILEPVPFAGIIGGVLLAGVLLGALVFGGGAPPPPVQGLTGVVKNPEITGSLNRCGIPDRNIECVYYFANPYRQEKEARAFYDIVAQLTGVQRYMVETSNLRYAGQLIKPGHIAQFRIPAVR